MAYASPFCFLYINQAITFSSSMHYCATTGYVCMCRRLMLAGLLDLRGFQLPGCKLQNHCKIYAVETATQRECCFSFWSTLESTHLFGGKKVHSLIRHTVLVQLSCLALSAIILVFSRYLEKVRYFRLSVPIYLA